MSGWMDKDVVYVYNVIFAHEKERNLVICDNIDKPRECYTKWMSDSKKKKIYISFHLESKRKSNEQIKTDLEIQRTSRC